MAEVMLCLLVVAQPMRAEFSLIGPKRVVIGPLRVNVASRHFASQFGGNGSAEVATTLVRASSALDVPVGLLFASSLTAVLVADRLLSGADRETVRSFGGGLALSGLVLGTLALGFVVVAKALVESLVHSANDRAEHADGGCTP